MSHPSLESEHVLSMLIARGKDTTPLLARAGKTGAYKFDLSGYHGRLNEANSKVSSRHRHVRLSAL
jgi:hypothetical protein